MNFILKDYTLRITYRNLEVPMQITVTDKHHLLSASSLSKIKARLYASFSKFGFRVSQIDLKVRDLNGPRGGIDKECKVVVRVERMGDIVVSSRDRTLTKAIPDTINRAARTVTRRLERRSIENRQVPVVLMGLE
ncbi:MAG: hypothetical protein AAF623_04865 [Planctomycetota bacterium]